MTKGSYTLSMPRLERIGIVGCGGTGSLLAEKLMRLMIGSKASLVLIDHDHVEEHNLLRQGFYQKDLGENKAVALADRLARNFRRKVTAVPARASEETLRNLQIIVGCVDNAQARQQIERLYEVRQHGGYHAQGWYIDAGNDQSSGQLLIGNMAHADRRSAKDWFDHHPDGDGCCHRLPSPGTQQPELLVPRPEHESEDMDCAQAIMLQDQDPAINDAMATLVNNTIYRMVTNRCTHMAQYLDLERGMLSTVTATPENVLKVMN